MKEKACFYSKCDLSMGYNLELSEKCIHKFQQGKIPKDLEGIIELYNVKQFFDNDCRLRKWSEIEFVRLKDTTKSFNTTIANFFNTIDKTIIFDEYNKLEWDYHQTFWEIIDRFKLYNLVDSSILRSIVSEDINNLILILYQKGIVDIYGEVIREILLKDTTSALLILKKYVCKRNNTTDKDIFFPKCLTQEDKEKIINNYLNGDKVNLNYVRLVTQVKASQSFYLSPKTKLKAERLEKKLNKDLFKDSRAYVVHSQELFQLINEKEAPPIKVEYDANKFPIFTYNLQFIQSCNNTYRITNCISLFNWMNNHFLIELINKRTEVDTLESIMIHFGRNSYPAYTVFMRKNDRALNQTALYFNALESLNSSFEEELKQYYEKRLSNEYDYPGLTINMPSSNDSWINKCKVLFPELDAIVKQYNTFVEEDEIDPELIRLSPPLKMTNGKSLLINKYVEIKDGESEIWNILSLLFSSQSLLAYVNPFKDKKYRSLINLLEQEIVAYENYEEHQRPKIDYLISNGIISIDANKNITITNKKKIEVLKSFFEYNVCSYWHYDDEERKYLDEMIAKGWLRTDDHLLSKPERDYFSYYLDNSEFVNGYAYRNQYAHGNTSPENNESTHKTAYYVFLRLLTILILKMDDDLWLARRALAIETCKH